MNMRQERRKTNKQKKTKRICLIATTKRNTREREKEKLGRRLQAGCWIDLLVLFRVFCVCVCVCRVSILPGPGTLTGDDRRRRRRSGRRTGRGCASGRAGSDCARWSTIRRRLAASSAGRAADGSAGRRRSRSGSLQFVDCFFLVQTFAAEEERTKKTRSNKEGNRITTRTVSVGLLSIHNIKKNLTWDSPWLEYL